MGKTKTIILGMVFVIALALVAFTGTSPPTGSSATNYSVNSTTITAAASPATNGTSVLVAELAVVTQLVPTATATVNGIGASAGTRPYARVEEFNRPTFTGRVALNFKNANANFSPSRTDPRLLAYPVRV